MIAILLMVFSINGAWAQGHGVGNGGDGFEMNGKVYLRDLMEAGLEKNEIKFELPMLKMRDAASAVTATLPVSTEKLAIFLSHMEMVSPGMGELLAYGIRMHKWNFVATSLEPVFDNCNIISVPNGKLVQIANRMNATIRIDSSAWEKMSDENRIALVIHEVIYSLVYPRTAKPGECLYSGMKTREIVGVLFSPEFLEKGPILYKNIIEPEVDWPRNMPPELRDDAGIYSIRILKKTPSGYSDLVAVRNSLSLSYAELVSMSNSMCVQFIYDTSGGKNDLIVMRARLALRRFEGSFTRYDAGFGEQFHLQLRLRRGDLYLETEMTKPIEFDACKQTLRPLLERAPLEN